ncbi:hypothetical protein Patl1_28334 [Pistacia atlantica]|uniref:Uncharacterized protein n=1 Tax=Pistacia atlantica TaxID=434234 RepID=A0ACC1BFD3_9ROSI|nr:hypothetical protein Patl1_28334 [Pistacia atlantica]
MEPGSTSDSVDGRKRQKGRSARTRLGSMLPNIEPFVRKTDHNPRELRSWAKKTGFVSTFSGETTTSVSDKFDSAGFDIEKGRGGGGSSPKIEIDPILGRTRPNRGSEIEAENASVPDGRRNDNGRNGGILGFRDNGSVRGGEKERRRIRDEAILEDKVDERLNGNVNVNGDRNGTVNGNGIEVHVANPVETKKEEEKVERDEQIYMYPGGQEPADEGWHRQSEMRFGLRDNPGFLPLIYYGLQHFLSLAGSLIFIPLIIVPAMGGTDKDTATLISTMLLVTGVSTILHSYFGTRLPLVQGSSFVYLAPALVIINAREYRNLTEHVSSVRQIIVILIVYGLS